MLAPIYMRPCRCRILLFLICVFSVCIPGYAQDKSMHFRIASFRENQFDLTAVSPEHEDFDGDGMRYAIIKVKSVTPGDDLSQYAFDFFNMKHKIKQVNGEIWVYVQRNAKNIQVSRPGYAPVKYLLEPTIEAGRNYDMVISKETDKVYRQSVRFDVTPANSGARIMVQRLADGSQQESFGEIGEDGSVAGNLDCGRYVYSVVAEDYVTAKGMLNLTYSGPAPIGPTVTEKVMLTPDFSKVTFEVDADADIYIDGVKMGFRQATSNLKVGRQYEVECRQEGMRSTTRMVTPVDNRPFTVPLKAPARFTGCVFVTSAPTDASIVIDGVSYGKTPAVLKLPVGSYHMTLAKGCSLNRTEFNVTAGDTVDVPCRLIPFKSYRDFHYSVCGRIDRIGLGAGFDIGVCFKNISVEFGLSGGLTKGHEVGGRQYKMLEYEIRIGYMMGVSEKIGITPHVGCLAQLLSGKGKNYSGENLLCGSVSIGVSFLYKLSRWFGIFVSPEYAVPFSAEGRYNEICSEGGYPKGGFQTRIGFELSMPTRKARLHQ